MAQLGAAEQDSVVHCLWQPPTNQVLQVHCPWLQTIGIILPQQLQLRSGGRPQGVPLGPPGHWPNSFCSSHHQSVQQIFRILCYQFSEEVQLRKLRLESNAPDCRQLFAQDIFPLDHLVIPRTPPGTA